PSVFLMPGSWLTPGITGSAALTSVATSEAPTSGSEHHLAAHPDGVSVDRSRAGAGVPRDGLGHVDGQAALRHGVEALAHLAGGEGDRGGHLRDDEAGRHGVDGDAVVELVAQALDQADD